MLGFSEAFLLRRESSGIHKSLGVMYLAPHPKRSTKNMSHLIITTSFLITSFVFTSCSLTSSTVEDTKVESTSVVDTKKQSETIKGVIEGEQIVANISFKPYSGKQTHWLGTDGGVPELIIESFNVTKNGKLIDIPYYLYSDFSDFSIYEGSLELYKTVKGFYVSYSGSDGAGSYGATFFFDESGLHKLNIGYLGIDENNLVGRLAKNRYTRQDKQN